MRVTVTRAAAAAARRGHPWIFRDGIPRPPRALPSGAVVELVDDAGEALGVGLWDALSPIACRVYAVPAGEPLDTRHLLGLVARAAERRERWFTGTDTTAYRLCNGEGDRIPGLVLDRYEHVAVLRVDGEALFAWVPRLVGGLMDLLRPLGVRTLVRRLRREEGGEDRTELLAGEPMPPRLVVREHGMAMAVDLAEGQKTGAFLDQRENRRRVRGLARGRVLNLFSYAGGFSVAAALGGASHVTSVDLAAAAHRAAQESFTHNGLDPRAHGWVTADAFVFLEGEAKRGTRYDLVISDPPSFAPREKAKERALLAYRKLHRAAARVLAPGGLLAAASCSSHVTAEDFLGTLDDAALERSDLRLLDFFGPPADHPSLPAFPEGRYLKMALLG